MKRTKTIINITAFVLILLLTIKPAHAISKIGSGYTAVSFHSLVISLLTSYISAERPATFIDGYARIFHCDLVKQSFVDEFKWVKVRDSLNEEINKIDRNYFSHYEFTGPIQLKKYDFKKESFPLHYDSALNNVGLLNMYALSKVGARSGFCDDFFAKALKQYITDITELLPRKYFVKIEKPINLKEIKASHEEAKNFVTYFTNNRIIERTVYIRFRVRLQGIDKVKKLGHHSGAVTFNGKLHSVDIFLDPELTKHFKNIKIE